MTFGEKLQKLRKEEGLSQEELACQLGVSRQAISKWERDSGYPETDKILRMGKIFHVSLDYLLGEDEGGSAPDIPEGLYVSRESAEGFLLYEKRNLGKIAAAVGLIIAGLAFSFLQWEGGTLLWLITAIVGVLLIFSAVLADNPYRRFSREPLTMDKSVRAELCSTYAEKKKLLHGATLAGIALIGLGLLVFPMLVPAQYSIADNLALGAGMVLTGAGSFLCIYAHGMTQAYRLLTANEHSHHLKKGHDET